MPARRGLRVQPLRPETRPKTCCVDCSYCFPPKYEACLVPVCVHVRFAADCKAVTGRLGVAPASTIASTSGAILVRVSSRSTASTTCRGSPPLNCSSLETAISLQHHPRGG